MGSAGDIVSHFVSTRQESNSRVSEMRLCALHSRASIVTAAAEVVQGLHRQLAMKNAYRRCLLYRCADVREGVISEQDAHQRSRLGSQRRVVRTLVVRFDKCPIRLRCAKMKVRRLVSDEFDRL